MTREIVHAPTVEALQADSHESIEASISHICKFPPPRSFPLRHSR
jgi:hypothetical protein